MLVELPVARMAGSRSGGGAKMRLTSLLVAAFAVTLLAGSCDKPYFQSLTKIDENSPQQQASIIVTGAQIYSRERLVNERRTEDAHYEAYLAKAVPPSKIEYVSSVWRNLLLISSLAAEVNLTFDPGGGAAFRRSESVAKARTAVDVQALQNQIQQLRNDATKIKVSADTPGSTTKDTEQSKKRLEQLSNAANTLIGKIDNMRDLLNKLTLESQGPNAGDAKSTPQEMFRDISALRATIRAAQRANALDDRHDYKGGALYRLQFRATILPGKRKNEHAVAQFTVRPPTLSFFDYRKLYLAWLGHITRRMNANRSSQGQSLGPNALYEGLAASTNTFVIADFYFAPTDSIKMDRWCASPQVSRRQKQKKCDHLSLAVPPRLATVIEKAVRFQGVVPEFKRERIKLLRTGLYKVNQSGKLKRCVIESTDPKAAQIKETFESAKEFVQGSAAIAASLAGLSGLRNVPPRSIRRLNWVLSEILRPAAFAFAALSDHHRKMKTWNCEFEYPSPRTGKIRKVKTPEHYKMYLADRGQRYAPGFAGLLRTSAPFCASENITESARRKSGLPPCVKRFETDGQGTIRRELPRVFAYSTAPLELAQRVSTLTSVSQALELAFGITALLPAQGVRAGGNVKYARLAAGKVGALERNPLVVGFAGRHLDPKNRDVKFGWIFGPKVVVDPENHKIKLEQVVISYPVSADIVVPGWWPRIHLDLETVWVGNWHQGESQVINPSKQRSFTVPLPLNRADLDGVTAIIADRAFGQSGIRNPQITDVIPNEVSACLTNQTFFVYGANLWRNAQVTLGGIAPTETVSILPDMGGVKVTFPIKGPNTPFPEGKELTLVVSAQHGRASWSIKWTKCTPTKPKVKTVVLKPKAQPKIQTVSPAKIHACAEKFNLVVSGTNLTSETTIGKFSKTDGKPQKIGIYLGSLKAESVNVVQNVVIAKAKAKPKTPAVRQQTILATFKGPLRFGSDRTKIELIVASNLGTNMKAVTLVKRAGGTGCPPAQMAGAPTAVKILRVLTGDRSGTVNVCAATAALKIVGTGLAKVDKVDINVKPKSHLIRSKAVAYSSSEGALNLDLKLDAEVGKEVKELEVILLVGGKAVASMLVKAFCGS